MARDELLEFQRPSLPNLIAWLSLCLISASMGTWANVIDVEDWVYFGVFGLIASVGLDSVGQMRRIRRRKSETVGAALDSAA